MENERFDLSEWIGNVNNSMIQSNTYFNGMAKAIDIMKKDGIDAISKEVGNLKRTVSKLSNDISIIKDENNEIKEDYVKVVGDLHKIKEKTDVIEFEDTETMGKIKKQAKSRISQLLGGEGAPQYKILFRSCISNLYSKIGDNLCGGKRIGKVKVEDGKSAISIAKNYYLNDKIINKKIQALRKEQEKGLLSKDKSIALDLTAEWMEERIYG